MDGATDGDVSERVCVYCARTYISDYWLCGPCETLEAKGDLFGLDGGPLELPYIPPAMDEDRFRRETKGSWANERP